MTALLESLQPVQPPRAGGGFPSRPRRALLCGLSTRAIGLFLSPLAAAAKKQGGPGEFNLSEHLEVVGVVEPDGKRVAAFEEKFRQRFPRFDPSEWDRALRETGPDTLLVAVPDYLHEEYILRGLEAGLDVISEKPMVISCGQARRVLAAERASKGKLSVAFNYRYHPLHAKIKEFLDGGRLGRIVQIDFNYCLDTLHGASYFYRWNRQRRLSGSLAIHKCCHSFDLIRWMIGQDPEMVMALGGLDYYGKNSAHRPGGPLGNRSCPYIGKWFKEGSRPEDQDHPIYDLQGDEGLPFAHQYPTRLTLYDPEIDVEDNYSALVRFDRGARMTFSVNFSSPWEGYRLAINGEQGRLEVQYFVSAARCPFPAQSTANFMPLFGGGVEPLEWNAASGGHGGADPQMLREIFEGGGALPDGRPLATAWDGMMAVACGEAVWRSALENRPILIKELIEGAAPEP